MSSLTSVLVLCAVFAAASALPMDTLVWPPIDPSNVSNGTATRAVDPCAVSFTTAASSAAITSAINLYTPYFCPSNKPSTTDALPVTLTCTNCVVQPPKVEEDESYSLSVPATGGASLSASSYPGLLRGLETLLQVIDPTTKQVDGVPLTIHDKPAYPHRGYLVDPARHFLSLDSLLRQVDALAASKMNVLHIHFTDSQSFPLFIPSHPELTQYGAIGGVYSTDDMKKLVDYATERGVRIVAETDTPGHARAWGVAPQNSDTVSCIDIPGPDYSKYCAEPPCGQLNPVNDATFALLKDVMTDVQATFPDTFYHVGYDEIRTSCWLDDPSIVSYMNKTGKTIQDILNDFFHQQKAFFNAGRRAVYWEEAAGEFGLPLTDTDVVQFWNNRSLLHDVLENTNSQVLISWADSGAYLDCGLGGPFGEPSWCGAFRTWLDIYSANILDGINATYAPRVLGGEAALWGELADSFSVDQKGWPRAAAYGGRLWSYEYQLPWFTAILALSRHVDRLQARGVGATRVAVEFCVRNPDLCYPSQ